MDVKSLSFIAKNLEEMVDNAIKNKKKQTVVEFDSKTNSPWRVLFSQRGFSIEGTRLSFELVDDALSKRYSIVLESGFVLDGVKLQKIIRYKDLY
jgi:hypothetical protein